MAILVNFSCSAIIDRSPCGWPGHMIGKFFSRDWRQVQKSNCYFEGGIKVSWWNFYYMDANSLLALSTLLKPPEKEEDEVLTSSLGLV